MSPTRADVVVISGSSGFVGTELVRKLEARGTRVIRLVRKPAQGVYECTWEPSRTFSPTGDVARARAWIHLGGVSVAEGRWNEQRKARILQSRVESTRALVSALLALPEPPPTFLCASGIGYFGDGGSDWLTETSPCGETFLAEVCRQWETEAERAASKARTAELRFGAVLGRSGGALAKLLPLFQAGLGGRLGSGQQYMSWIALSDAVAAIVHCLDADEVAGPVNLVSPNPVTNREFTTCLARTLRRPAWAPVPGFALRAAVGEFAGELLRGQRASPEKLLRSGFSFAYPTLEDALAAELR